jgi:hypothetical protein
MKSFRLRIQTQSGWITEVVYTAANQWDAKMMAEGQYGPGCVVGYL